MRSGFATLTGMNREDLKRRLDRKALAQPLMT
jgi:hypothetical protein